MKKLLFSLIVFLATTGIAYAAPTEFFLHSTTTPGCLNLANSGLVWSSGSACGTGSGGSSTGLGASTSTNPFMASYFVATSTAVTATSTFNGPIDVYGSARFRGNVSADVTLTATGNTTIGGTINGLTLNISGTPMMTGTGGSGISDNNNSLDLYANSVRMVRMRSNGGLSIKSTASGDITFTSGDPAAGGDDLFLKRQTAGVLSLTSNGTTGGVLGIGTTSPSSLFALGVQGNGLFSGNISAANITATGTATIGGTLTVGSSAGTIVSGNGNLDISANATNLTGLGNGQAEVIINGLTTGTVARSVTFGNGFVRPATTNAMSLGQSGNLWTTGWFNTGLFVGTTTPFGLLSINPTAANTGAGPEFVIGSSTATHFIVTNQGNVGVGTTSPVSLLAVTGTTTVSAAALNQPFYGLDLVNTITSNNSTGNASAGIRFSVNSYNAPVAAIQGAQSNFNDTARPGLRFLVSTGAGALGQVAGLNNDSLLVGVPVVKGSGAYGSPGNTSDDFEINSQANAANTTRCYGWTIQQASNGSALCSISVGGAGGGMKIGQYFQPIGDGTLRSLGTILDQRGIFGIGTSTPNASSTVEILGGSNNGGIATTTLIIGSSAKRTCMVLYDEVGGLWFAKVTAAGAFTLSSTDCR